MSDAQGIVTGGGDANAAPGAERVEPGPEGMRNVYTIVAAHQGIINKYLILQNGLVIVGEFWTESAAIAALKLMNEMAGKA